MLDNKILASVNKNIYGRFPEVKGARPQVMDYEENKFLLVYSGTKFTANGHPIPRVVRVVVDETGKMGKVTTSR